ncbi:MAG: TROVE domain-containing protein [Bacteroidota bacterium]
MRFNIKTKRTNKVKNYEADEAYTMSPALELYASVVTTTLADKFYEKDQKRIVRLRKLIAKNDPRFVAKLAVYAREQMHLRSVPLVLAVELAKVHRGDSLVSQTVARVVQRADEITELLAYYAVANQRKGTKQLNLLSKQIQKGLAQVFNRFDAYQLAKYNRATSIKLKDALFLVHPKAKDEAQQGIFNQLVNDTLPTPYTWETELSAQGQQTFADEAEKQLAFRNKWEELIDSGKLGYMAMLRNLRNILEAEVSADRLQKVCGLLSDERAVARSKQLPFRFLAAYREIKALKLAESTMVLNALEAAVRASAINIPGFDENVRVLIACDVSGSMQRAISPKSKIQNYDIGLMLGMLLQSQCKRVITGIFGDRWKVINLPQGNILANVDELHRREGEVGYFTNGYLVVKDLIQRRKVVDKVMIFTDCQLWNSNGAWGTKNTETIAQLWGQYKQIAPEAKLYLFDLAGYGSTPLDIRGNDVFFVAGWSDKVFAVLQAIENGSHAVAEIKKIAL